jgi:hypothetical protein
MIEGAACRRQDGPSILDVRRPLDGTQVPSGHGALRAQVTSHLQRLDPNIRPARAPDSVVVYEQAPEQPYTVLARVDSRADDVFTSFDDLRVRIIDQAAQLGGEAVIIGPESKETEFLILVTGMIPSEKKKLAGDVIVIE